MLHQHPEICAPHPPHILQIIMPLLPKYGDLSIENNFSRLVDDSCTLVELNPVSWNIKFDREKVKLRCENKSLPQIMKAIYELKAESMNASHWICKSMASVHYFEEMESAGLHPFYIYLFRDGRDVALSFLKAMVGEKHIYHLAKQWKVEQELSLAICSTVGDERCIKIKYEDFTQNPEPVLKTICNKIGLRFTNEMLNYIHSEESKETAASGKMWANLVNPVMKNNSKKYLNGLSAEQIELFESIAGDTLEKLGYAKEVPLLKSKNYSPEEISVFDLQNQNVKTEAKKSFSTEDIKRRAEQDNFIFSIRNF